MAVDDFDKSVITEWEGGQRLYGYVPVSSEEGSSSGLTLRSSKKNKSRLNPTFLIHQINQVDKTVKYEKLTSLASLPESFSKHELLLLIGVR